MKVAPDNRYDYGTVVIHTEMDENGTMILELANGQKITIDQNQFFLLENQVEIAVNILKMQYSKL